MNALNCLSIIFVVGAIGLPVWMLGAVIFRKRELRASDLRGSGGHRKPPLGEKRAVRWDVLNKAKLAIDEAKRDEELHREPDLGPFAALSLLDRKVWAEQIPHARDPFAAWDGKQFVPVVDAPRVPANPMFDWIPVQPPDPALMAELGRIQGMAQSISGWRGTGGARGETDLRTSDGGPAAGQQMGGSGPVHSGRSPHPTRETGPEAKWVP